MFGPAVLPDIVVKKKTGSLVKPLPARARWRVPACFVSAGAEVHASMARFGLGIQGCMGLGGAETAVEIRLPTADGMIKADEEELLLMGGL